MWCGVLGPLIVRSRHGEPLVIAGPARRLLLAALVSRVGRTVSPDTLVEDVWGHVPPRTAIRTLHSHVARLRDDLGRDPALVTAPTGYRLELAVDDVDAGAFALAVERAGECSAAGDFETAAEGLAGALSLWRGDAYEEFPEAAVCVSERLRLAELRAFAEEEHTEAVLRLGRSGELVADLERRVAAAPYRERSWEQLIIALYRAGRQADALGAFRRARSVLADDLGVDPGPRLRQLEQQILEHDPDLFAAAPQARPTIRLAAAGDACPYVGLASYRENDGALFVGRERLTAELVGLLADNHVLAVVGASGTGKSSLLRAGLVPALRGGALPGSAAWRIVTVTPADAAEGAAIGDPQVLVLDQAEDMFGQLSAAQRADLVDRLEEYVGSGGRLVFALRADFYGRLAEVQPLAAYAQTATALVGPLREDELRRVLLEPAERVGLSVEPALVDVVMDEVSGQPAALPLLSMALVRTWENRDGNRLTLDGYRRGGGVTSALESAAEDAYANLRDEQRVVARRLLVRLAAREGGAWVRRAMRRLDTTTETDAEAVIGSLAAARLVTVGEQRVEITHDALLAHWPRLREWLEERALAAELLDHLEVATRAWQAAGRPDSDLYRGARLRSALDWRESHPEDIAGAEAEFLDASATAADAELIAARTRAQQEAQGRRRLRVVAVGLAVMVLLAAVGVAVALHERGTADRSARQARAAALSADARRLAALSLTAPDVATSSLLAVAAYRLQDSADTRGALLSAVERNASAVWRIATPHRLLRVATTPGGGRIAVSDNRGDVTVFDARTRRQVNHFASHADLLEGLTPDGRNVLVYGPDPSEPPIGRLSVLSVATGARVRVLTTQGAAKPQIEPAISTDGSWIAVLTSQPLGTGVAVDVFDTHNLSAPPRRFAVPSGSVAVAAGRSSVAIQHADGSVEVRALPSVRVTARIRRTLGAGMPESGFALAPDGSSVAIADPGDSRRIALFDTHSGTRVVIPTQTQSVGAFAYSPDGAELAVATLAGAVTVYRTSDGTTAESLAGHAGPAIGVAWSGLGRPSGLYTVGLDSELVSWSVSTAPRLVTESGLDIAIPDRGELFGHYALGMTGSRENPPGTPDDLYRADIRTGQWSAWSIGVSSDDLVNQAVSSADGQRGLISIQDATGRTRVEIWDLVHHVRVGRLALPPTAALRFPIGLDAAISPDGRTAYASLDASHIGVFALPSGRYLRSFSIHFTGAGRQTAAVPWQFDPRGRLVVASLDLVGPHQRLGLLDTRSDKLLAQVDLGDVTSPTALAWSHAGHQLAVGTFDGTVTLLDADTLSVRAGAGAVEPGLVHTVSFAPDDRTLVVAGTAGSLTFLSLPDLDREGIGLPIGSSANRGGVFAWYAPNGDVVGFAQDPARTARPVQRWFDFRAAPAALATTACALAGGNLSRSQWARLLPDLPYRRVCPAPHS